MQSPLPQCKASALKAVIVGSGIKAAFCSDTHLVILSDGSPSWTPNLDDVPNPPGSTYPLDSKGTPLANGTACVTRSASITPSFLHVGSTIRARIRIGTSTGLPVVYCALGIDIDRLLDSSSCFSAVGCMDCSMLIDNLFRSTPPMASLVNSELDP